MDEYRYSPERCRKYQQFATPPLEVVAAGTTDFLHSSQHLSLRWRGSRIRGVCSYADVFNEGVGTEDSSWLLQQPIQPYPRRRNATVGTEVLESGEGLNDLHWLLQQPIQPYPRRRNSTVGTEVLQEGEGVNDLHWLLQPSVHPYPRRRNGTVGTEVLQEGEGEVELSWLVEPTARRKARRISRDSSGYVFDTPAAAPDDGLGWLVQHREVDLEGTPDASISSEVFEATGAPADDGLGWFIQEIYRRRNPLRRSAIHGEVFLEGAGLDDLAWLLQQADRRRKPLRRSAIHGEVFLEGAGLDDLAWLLQQADRRRNPLRRSAIHGEVFLEGAGLDDLAWLRVDVHRWTTPRIAKEATFEIPIETVPVYTDDNYGWMLSRVYVANGPRRKGRQSGTDPNVLFEDPFAETPEPIVTKLHVFNEASAALGVPFVSEPDENTQMAVNHRAMWDMSRRSFIEMHSWTGATFTRTLAQLSTNPNPRWTFAFGLPYDFMRLVAVNGVQQSEGRTPWEIETDPTTNRRMLLTDEAEVSIKYIGDVLDVTGVSPLALKALGRWLAADEAAIYGRDEAFIARLRSESTALLDLASSVNSQGSGTPPRRNPSPIFDDRRGRGGSTGIWDPRW